MLRAIPDSGLEARNILEELIGNPTRQVMTPRQRVEAAIQHQSPDRVPFDFWAVPEEWEKLRRYLGVQIDEEVLRLLGIDCRLMVPAYVGPAPVDLGDGVYVEPWGSMKRLQATPYGVYEEYAAYPLAQAQDTAQVETYPYWPKTDYWDVSQVKTQITQLNNQVEYHLRYEVGGIFESAWGLFGLEQFLVHMATGEMDIPNTIMACYTELFIANTCRVLEAGDGQIDMVYIFDDIGTQLGPLMSVKMWREYILPWHLRLLEAIHRYDVRVMYHSCGAIYPFINELINEMKIDVLNPLQPRATGMDFTRIKQEFGHCLAFHGGIDLQDTLPHASPAQVQQEVTECMRVLGKDGGYICASAHYLQADVPVENVIAMYSTPRVV